MMNHQTLRVDFKIEDSEGRSASSFYIAVNDWPDDGQPGQFFSLSTREELMSLVDALHALGTKPGD